MDIGSLISNEDEQERISNKNFVPFTIRYENELYFISKIVKLLTFMFEIVVLITGSTFFFFYFMVQSNILSYKLPPKKL